MGRWGFAGRPQTQLGFFSTVSHRDEASDSNGVAYIKGKAGKEAGEGMGGWGRGFVGRNSREVALTSRTSSEVIREVIRCHQRGELALTSWTSVEANR